MSIYLNSTIKCSLLTIALFAICLSGSFALAEDSKEESNLSRVKGTRVSISAPKGFEPAPSFNGYVLKDKSASIIVTEMPAPVDKLMLGFTQENLAKKKMQLLSKEEIEIAGQKGTLIKVSQSLASLTFEKWITVFGDSNNAVVVMAVYPERYSEELAEKMKKSVSIVEWNRDLKISKTENLNFEVTPKEPFQLAHRFQNSLLFTSKGHFPSKDASDPLYIVAESTGNFLITNKKEYCVNRIKEAESLKDVKETSVNPVKISGLEGYEVIADAVDSKNNQKMFIYQVLLFSDKSIFLHQGFGAENDREKYVPLFKAMSETFKVK